MVVTEKAAQILKEILTAHATQEEDILRLTGSSEEGFGLVLNTEKAEDEVFQVLEKKVLVVDNGTSTDLEGATLNCVDTPHGVRLTLRR